MNLWNANCGASFEWVGRAINPYLGFMTGWLMVTGSLVGAVSGVVILAPSVLAIFNDSATSTWPNILIATAVILLMLIIAAGRASLASGFLIAVFMYTGWDATVYVNEEVKQRRRNPGRAAVLAGWPATGCCRRC